MSVHVFELGMKSKASSTDDRVWVLGPPESSAVETKRSANRRDLLRGGEDAALVSVAAARLRTWAGAGSETSRPAAARSAAR